jgi:hypothetical protein
LRIIKVGLGKIMSALKLRKNTILTQEHEAAKPHLFFSPRRPWMYVSILGAAGFFLFINFAIMPLVVHGYAVAIGPTVSQAKPGLATANLLSDLNSQNLAAWSFGGLTHPYLAGRGTLLVFAGDNIQIFEYPTDETARAEALAISGRSPRLAAQIYFHLYLRGNLIGLYFGYNAEVLRITEGEMGPPLALSGGGSSSAVAQ